MRRSIGFSGIVAGATVFIGAVAAAAAVGWSAVTSTDPESHWRDLEGTFAPISIGFAMVAFFLGIIIVPASWRSRRSAVAGAGLSLAAATLGYWIWLIPHLGG